ncbi:MAG: HDIG domain-containing protein [Bacillota bacterium]|nr:HAD family hydrolase [Bacillota bacterium]REJ36896.1 MAG: HAD family hydrolase [Bacillota bacterium]
MTRAAAWELLTQYTKSESLLRHALAVEAAMRAYARRFGEDEERWGITGLLHDFDYERWPNPPDHPLKGAAILEELGYPEDVIYAIKSHADYLNLERRDLMSKTLYAVDEMSGFVMAVALVRPNKSIHEVEVQSVKKKMKDKAFAKGVHRDQLVRSAAELGVDLDDHIQMVIDALRSIAPALGLDGQRQVQGAGAVS